MCHGMPEMPYGISLFCIFFYRFLQPREVWHAWHTKIHFFICFKKFSRQQHKIRQKSAVSIYSNKPYWHFHIWKTAIFFDWIFILNIEKKSFVYGQNPIKKNRRFHIWKCQYGFFTIYRNGTFLLFFLPVP